MKNKKGFALLPVLLVILAVVIVGGGAYAYYFSQQTLTPQATVSQQATNSAPTEATDSTLNPHHEGPQTQTSLPFRASPTSGDLPLQVNFDVSSINTQTIADTYAVDFGDGSKGSLVLQCKGGINGPAVCAGADAIHTYTTAGSRVAKLVSSHGSVVGSVTVTVTGQQVSVANMSQYTDTSFGFSFWYPSNWSVTKENPIANPWVTVENATLTNVFDVGPSGRKEVRIEEAESPTMAITDTGGAGPFGPIKYFFSSTEHAWMSTAPQGTPTRASGATTTIRSFVNTMGGLHMLGGTSRFDTSIIPLSAEHFVIVSDGGGVSADYLAKTVTAVDPSVATPASDAEQTTIIQAEAAAYAGQ